MNSITLISLSRVSAIPGIEPVFRIQIRSEFSYIKTIPAVSPAFTLFLQNSINPTPYLCRLFFWILPNRPKPLIASLE